MSVTPTSTPTPAPAGPTARRVPRSVLVSAWAVPVMLVGGFAMLAVVPVTVAVVGILRDARLRALRWWAAALGLAYATPLALWAIGPDRAPSLTKDMHPAPAAVIVAVSLGLVAVLHLRGRAGRR
ncbi:hypothetical protein [Actinomycetospora straminea]|uniref:Uncharacterized protein n=1 Tax=Actinomycetospora straminea TaxID=663607 RepID=A0ABP9EZB1_9PSEU|nr:hypothetical protein [Actinomycetospora straminea]MDD7931819.1 hypothetical protein [Actinomycetospora straminea]